MKTIYLIFAVLLFFFNQNTFAVGFTEKVEDGERVVDKLFPNWGAGENDPIKGVIGYNQDLPVNTLNGQDEASEKLLLFYIPTIINILLKFVAPIVMCVCIFAGLRFVYASDNEEDLTKAKQFFTYALMGVGFIVISYSIMKAVYFVLSTS